MTKHGEVERGMRRETMPVADDLEMIRDLLAESGPGAQVAARGRDRLMAQTGHDAGRSLRQDRPHRSLRQDRPHRSLRQDRPQHRVRRTAIGGGVTLTAAAAALAVFAATAGTGASPRLGRAAGAHGGQTVLSARDILLTAARQSASAPLATGRYWLTKTVEGTNLEVGPPGDRYTITMKDSDDQWTARAADGTSRFVSQSLGTQPATAADAAAWKRDGSPSKWSVTLVKYKRGAAGQRVRLPITAAPGKPFGNRTNIGDKVFAIGGQNVSLRQVQALPANPARLKARLLADFAAPGGSGGDLPTHATDWLWQVGTSMIIAMPLTPRARAAAYRMLAGLPGVRSLGQVRDPDGRTGVAVAMTDKTQAGGTQESRLIVDRATGLPLALEYRAVHPAAFTVGLAAVASYQVITFAGWSNAAPPRMSAP
jgi:hypothetical protein